MLLACAAVGLLLSAFTSAVAPAMARAEPVEGEDASGRLDLHQAFEGRGGWIVTIRFDGPSDLKGQFVAYADPGPHQGSPEPSPVAQYVSLVSETRLISGQGYVGSYLDGELVRVGVDEAGAVAAVPVEGGGVGWEQPGTFRSDGSMPLLQFIVASTAPVGGVFLNLTWAQGVVTVESQVVEASGVTALRITDFDEGVGLWARAAVAAGAGLTHTVDSNGGLVGWFLPEQGGPGWTDHRCSSPAAPSNCFDQAEATQGALFGRLAGPWTFQLPHTITAMPTDWLVLLTMELPSLEARPR